MFSIVASRVPAGWPICGGLQTEHQDGVTECSRGAACIGAAELHAAWRSCRVAHGDAETPPCSACGPQTAVH